MRIKDRAGIRARITAAAVTGALGLGGIVVVSPPASAVPNWQVDISCTGDVILPGEPGDFYDFVLDPACRTGGVPYVFNSMPDGDGWVAGMGFLGVPSNLASSYDPHSSRWTYGFPTPDPGDWYVAAIVGAPTYALMPLEGIELQADNYIAAPIGGLGTAVGAVESGNGDFFTIYWGNPPSPSGGSGPTPTPTYTLTSNPEDRGTCWPTVSGVSGTWVKLTDSGCAPPKPGATLLGWATSPLFPVAEARKVVDNGWTAYDGSINGVRMVFIPVNGYTALTGDQTMYPIWST